MPGGRPKEADQLRREDYGRRFGLNKFQMRRLRRPQLEQLDCCPSDDERRVLLGIRA